MEEYITAAEAARIIGLNTEYAAHLARKSHREGNPWPRKRGRYWYAPLHEWEKILSPEGKVQRKMRKQLDEKAKKKPEEKSKLITAAEAAKILGLSPSWAAELARRSHRLKNEWPKKLGRYWMASIENWQRIFDDDSLKSWSRYQKK